MEEICGHRKDEWKYFKFVCLRNTRAHNLLESQGNILGSMNVVTHDLVLTENPRARKDQIYGGPQSCHPQWTICDHRKFRPACYVYQGHINFLEVSRAYGKRSEGPATNHRDRDGLVCH
jgi:hypothetical protein